MKVCAALGVRPGVTSVIGGGGKSTLLEVLALELAPASVILCTTTHMFPPRTVATADTTDEGAVRARLAERGALCLGTWGADGRLRTPALPMERLAALADYVIVEADGSRQLPLKAHAPHEPAVPPESSRTVWVVGLSGLGRPIREVAHRPERFAALAEATVDDLATPERVARVIDREANSDIVLLNQADIPDGMVLAWAVARSLVRPAVASSLQRRECLCLW